MYDWLQKIDPIALWGAVVSTILAVREILKARTKIEVGHNFTGLPDIGNEVVIRNISSSPIIITYWELAWCKREFFRWVQFKGKDPGEFPIDIKLSEHSSTRLLFRDEEYFDWTHNSLMGGKIFLKLHIAGKNKPLFLRVYG